MKVIFEDFTSLCAICAPLLILFILNILIGQNSDLDFVYQVRQSSLSYTWTIWLFSMECHLNGITDLPRPIVSRGYFLCCLTYFHATYSIESAHTFVNYILQYQLNTCTSLWLGLHLFSIFINDLVVNIECNIKLFCRQHFSLHNF